MLAVVSHDLKGPLSAIRISAAMVRRTAHPDAGDARLQKHLELVQRSVDRMSAIIRDLLEAAAIDLGHVHLNVREEDAGAIVDEAVELEQPAAIRKRHTLVVDNGIVKAHGGRLWVESDLGVGSSFHFTLPLHHGAREDKGARRAYHGGREPHDRAPDPRRAARDASGRTVWHRFWQP